MTQTIISYKTKHNPHDITTDYAKWAEFNDKTFKCIIIQGEVTPEKAILIALQKGAVKETIYVQHTETYKSKPWQKFSKYVVTEGNITTQQ